jgi:hypothetical protein
MSAFSSNELNSTAASTWSFSAQGGREDCLFIIDLWVSIIAHTMIDGASVR